jgi:tRNA nucleotidyltransferase (CCA-adding enzyme)
VPSLDFTKEPDLTRWPVAYTCLEHLSRTQSPASIYNILVQSNEDAYFAWVLASLCPWNSFSAYEAGSKSTKPDLPMVARVARDGLKVPNKLSDLISASHCHREEILAIREAFLNNSPVSQERDTLAMTIRRWASRSKHWQIQVLYAVLTEAMAKFDQWNAELPGTMKLSPEVLFPKY